MAYLWGSISRSDAEAKLEAAGCEPGQFLVRSRGDKYPGDYVLCVAYKGKPTHHLAQRNEDGELVVNKSTFGSNKTIEELIDTLATKPKGWPVALTKPIKNPGASTPKKKAAKAKGGGKKKATRPGWLHGNLTKEEASELVNNAGATKGQYLVRSRAGKKTEYVLCVAFKGKATHHLIKKNEDGFYVINGKNYGDSTKLQGLIKHLSKPGVPNWPVQLTDPIIRRGAEEAEAPASKEPEPAADVAEEPAKEPEKEPEPDHPPREVAPPDNGATDVEPAKEEPETAPEPAAVDELAADTAAPAEPEAAKPGSTVQRTLLRAVLAINTKMSKFEADIAELMGELNMFEQFAVQGVAAAQEMAQASGKDRRGTFDDLDLGGMFADGGHSPERRSIDMSSQPLPTRVPAMVAETSIAETTPTGEQRRPSGLFVNQEEGNILNKYGGGGVTF